MDVDKVPSIITASCILHNLCEINREHFNDVWLEEVDNSDAKDNVFLCLLRN